MRPGSASSRFFASVALGTALAWAGLPAVAQEAAASRSIQRAQFNVILADSGGLDDQTGRTLRSLTISELRKLGYSVSNDPVWEGIHPAGEETQALLKRAGGRTLSLRVAGRLGAKVPLSLEELNEDGTVIGSSSLTASSLEECDIVIPRLVEALLGRKSVDSTARMTTVTTEESRPFQHRPGEGRFVIGLLNPLFSSGDGGKNGLSVGYQFEAEHFLVGIEGFYTKAGDSDIGSTVFLQGAWVPFSGEISPYLGGGIGYLAGKDQDISFDSGTGYKLTAGLEMFRLHRVRLQVGVDVYFPSSRKDGQKLETRQDPVNGTITNSVPIRTRSSYPVLHVKLGF